MRSRERTTDTKRGMSLGQVVMKPTGIAASATSTGEFKIKFSTEQRARNNVNIIIYLYQNKQNKFGLENVLIGGNQLGCCLCLYDHGRLIMTNVKFTLYVRG
jgi:hypothetical protein